MTSRAAREAGIDAGPLLGLARTSQRHGPVRRTSTTQRRRGQHRAGSGSTGRAGQLVEGVPGWPATASNRPCVSQPGPWRAVRATSPLATSRAWAADLGPRQHEPRRSPLGYGTRAGVENVPSAMQDVGGAAEAAPAGAERAHLERAARRVSSWPADLVGPCRPGPGGGGTGAGVRGVAGEQVGGSRRRAHHDDRRPGARPGVVMTDTPGRIGVPRRSPNDGMTSSRASRTAPARRRARADLLLDPDRGAPGRPCSGRSDRSAVRVLTTRPMSAGLIALPAHRLALWFYHARARSAAAGSPTPASTSAAPPGRMTTNPCTGHLRRRWRSQARCSRLISRVMPASVRSGARASRPAWASWTAWSAGARTRRRPRAWSSPPSCSARPAHRYVIVRGIVASPSPHDHGPACHANIVRRS